MDYWKQESLGPVDTHHPVSSQNLAQLVTFYPFYASQEQHESHAAFLLPREPPVQKAGQDEGRRI